MSISYAEDIGEKEALSLLHPILQRWVRERFGKLTPPQRLAVKPIREGRHTLIASPTGSGKTLAAFLPIISELIELRSRGELGDSVYAVYVSPLRALNNDVQKNLISPLTEIERLHGGSLGIRVMVRTGDTPQNLRSKMLRKPPHILITTPETLAILLVAPRFSQLLSTTRWVIVDEIHELCSSKRGVHLTLSLERLEERAPGFTRIGLSATIHPLEEVARFLTGYDGEGRERGCVIVDTRFVKPTSLRVQSPVEDLVHTPAEIVTNRMYSLLSRIIKRHRTTLIFTNTRSGTERVLYHLSKLGVASAEELAAHHSSLSRDVRKEVEDKLKNGEMKAVVTSTSLELGIDIGSIDVVVQIGSPKSVSRLLQRVGRSGHSLERTSKGILIAMDRDDLVEDAVMAREALRGKLDRVHIPRNALDVLAQHIVGMAIEKKWRVDEAYSLVKRSYCYRDLSLEDFESVLRYLSGKHKSLESKKVYGKIWWDEEEGVFGRRGKLARAIYSENVGTIPDEVSIKVYTKDGKWVGSIEEEFLERLTPGDVFVLGGRTYRFLKSKEMRAIVERAEGEKPTVPSWFSELLPLSFDTGEAVSEFRDKMFEMLKTRSKKDVLAYLRREYHVDAKAAKAIYGYFKAMDAFLDMLGVKSRPGKKTVLVERYLSPEGRLHVIFHAVFGRRVNDALSRAYAYAASKIFSVNVPVLVRDSAFSLILPPSAAGRVGELIDQIGSGNLRSILVEAVRHTEMAARRFRHCATRALMILRSYKGRETSIARRQVSAYTLKRLAEKLGDFPVLKETYREILEDLMDVENAEFVLREIEAGKRRIEVMPVYDVPSPFSHELIVSGYEDVVLMADRRKLLEMLHESVMERLRSAGLLS